MQHQSRSWRSLSQLLVFLVFTSLLPSPSVQAAPVRFLPTNLLPMKEVVQITAGSFHTCALTTKGAVKCWGENGVGQLGDGSTTNRLLPVKVVGLSSGVTAVSAGGRHTCALLDSGGVKCWGLNSAGQLGDGTTTQRLMPVDVVGLSSGVSRLAVGGQSTCAALIGGGVNCWGRNHAGQLGDGTTAERLTPVAVQQMSEPVVALSIGESHACAGLTGGGVKCWGDNTDGKLGDGGTTDRLLPVAVVGLSSQVIALTVSSSHTCALTNSGAVNCWGDNSDGQLGDGANNDRLTPGAVPGLTSGVSALAAGSSAHTCVLLSSGGARCFGSNTRGQLGDGSQTGRWTPVAVAGLNNTIMTAMAAGYYHTCAVTNSGGVLCWGANSDGQLGDGMTALFRATPIAVLEERYSLTMQVSGNGSVTASPAQASYAAGDAITLTALPAAGLIFVGWSGALTSTANPVTFTIGGDMSIIATFSEALAATPTPTGTPPPTATATPVAQPTNTPRSAPALFLPLVNR